MEPQKTNPESEVTNKAVEQTVVIKPKSSNTIIIYIAIAVFLGISLLITIGAIIFVLVARNSDTKKNGNDVNTPTITTVATTTNAVNPTVEVIYYLKSDGIYEFNLKTNTNAILLDKDDILTIYQIDNTTLGYAYSESSNRIVATFDLSTKTSKVLKTIDNESADYILWYSANKFSYLTYENDNTRKLYYVNGDNVLEQNLTGVSPQRGGSFAQDSNRAVVSPDNTKAMIQPVLLNNNKTDDYVGIQIYNTTDNSFQILEYANMGNWISDSEILYKDTKENKLYVYNVNTKTKIKYNEFSLSVGSIFGLHKQGNKLTYWRSDGVIYSYDLMNKTEKDEVLNATETVFLDNNRILYRPLPNCPPYSVNDECNLIVKIHDLTKSTDVQIDRDIISYTFIGHKGYYYCESSECGD
jgi:hypothetical protein